MASSPPPIDWPTPPTTDLEVLRVQTPELIFRARPVPGFGALDITNSSLRDLVVHPVQRVTRNEIIDGVLIRTYVMADSWPQLSFLFDGFTPSGRALLHDDASPAMRRMSAGRMAPIAASVRAVWEPAGVERDSVSDDVCMDEGIPFRIPEQLPEHCRGIVLHLWALGGNDYERDVAQQLAARGWLVVDIKPRTTAVPKLDDETVGKILALDGEQQALRASMPKVKEGESAASYSRRMKDSPVVKRDREISREIVDLRNPPLRLCAAEDVESIAAGIAERVDRVLAGNALAVGAILETTRRVHPSLRSAPVVVAGFSAGALSTPTAAAMLGSEVKAVVMVGGAANALGVATRSVLSRGGIKLLCDGKKPSPKLLADLSDAYLRHSRLDAFHTARHLEGLPVLVVDAGMDTWVPSDLGQLLYERLGKPERLHMAAGGHEMLFYLLTRRSGWIADWVTRAAGEST